MLAYADHLPRLRAEQVLEEAGIAASPHMGKARKGWIEAWQRRATWVRERVNGRGKESAPLHRQALFTWQKTDDAATLNEPLQAIEPGMLKRKLAGIFGGQVSE